MHIWCAPTWRLHTELIKFLWNISTNICGLGKRTDLKLGEVSSLFICNKITIFWLFPLNGFRFIFLLHDSENDLNMSLKKRKSSCPEESLGEKVSKLVWCVSDKISCFEQEKLPVLDEEDVLKTIKAWLFLYCTQKLGGWSISWGFNHINPKLFQTNRLANLIYLLTYLSG